MPRPEIHRDVDLGDMTAKRELQTELGRFNGLYSIVAKPIRPTRTGQQNRYFHGVVSRSFRDFMASQGQHFTHDQCYRYLAEKFIPAQPIVHPSTGEVLDDMPVSTAGLDVDEFAEFLDSCIFWLEDTFGITVPEPPPKPERRKARHPQPPVMT